MSLLSGASLWTSDDNLNKKRTPMLRRTIKKQPNYAQSSTNLPEPDEYILTDQNYQESKHVSIDETITINEDRNNKVNALLDKITATSDANDGQHLSNFSPPKNPELSQKKGYTIDDELTRNIPQPVIRKDIGESNYGANNLNIAKLSNYQTSYEIPVSPYYSKMGIGQSVGQDKVMEKINYLIHMLELERDEKNDTVLHDFILFSFVGIFVIFICDSFSRGGKYTR